MNPQLDDDDSPLDANGCLKDGRTYRVRMHARDSVQGAIAASHLCIHDGTDNPFALNRPGYRYNDSVDRSEAERAHQTMVLDAQERWRAGPGQQQDSLAPVGAHGPFELYRVGQPCTSNGRPGKLAASVDGQWLICESTRTDSGPAWRPDLSLRDAELFKQKAYDEMCREGEQAWKNLGRN
jgi:hypothetical protein